KPGEGPLCCCPQRLCGVSRNFRFSITCSYLSPHATLADEKILQHKTRCVDLDPCVSRGMLRPQANLLMQMESADHVAAISSRARAQCPDWTSEPAIRRGPTPPFDGYGCSRQRFAVGRIVHHTCDGSLIVPVSRAGCPARYKEINN